MGHCRRFECKLCSNGRGRVRTFCHNRDCGHGFCLDQIAGGCLSRMDWVPTDRIKRNIAGYPSQQRRHGVSIVPTGVFYIYGKSVCSRIFWSSFSQFINPANPILMQLLILATTYIVIDAAISLLWRWLGSRAAHGLTRISLGVVNKMCGLVMIGAAVLLAHRELYFRMR